MTKKTIATICLIFIFGLSYPACVFGAEGYDDVAPSSDVSSSKDVIKYGMTPVYGRDINDGNYDVDAASSSSFFRISKAKLAVKEGKMMVRMTISSNSYKFVYLGTPEEAAAAPLDKYIEPKDRDGESTFEFPLVALNKEIDCAAFSKKKKQWYPRKVLFDASSLPQSALKITLPDYDKIDKAMAEYDGSSGNSSNKPSAEEKSPALTSFDPMPVDMEDGEYSIQVQMTGGSGRASVTTPTWFIVKDGKAYAKLMWSSTYYDYMIVGGKKYLNETTDGGNSTFTIPIPIMDERFPVIADTTAMGDPVEIEYELTFYHDTVGSKNQIPQEAAIKVLIVSIIIIVIGGILNIVLKRRKKQ